MNNMRNRFELWPVLVAVSLILIIASIVLLAFPNIPGEFFSAIFFNSDSLFHNYFYLDIILERKDLSEWVLPRTFSLLPEFIIFLLVRMIVNDSVNINMAVSISVFSLLAFSLIYLYFKVFMTTCRSLVVFLLFLSFLILALPTNYFSFIYSFLLSPHFHNGMYVSVVLSLILYLGVSKRGKPFYWVLFILIVFLFTFSDILFFFYFSIPVFLAVFFENGFSVKKISLGVSIIVSSIIGGTLYMIGFLVSPFSTNPTLEKIKLSYLLEGGFEYFRGGYVFHIPNPLIVYLFFCMLGFFYCLWYLFKYRNKSEDQIFVTKFTLFCFISGFFTYTISNYGSFYSFWTLILPSLFLLVFLGIFLSNWVTSKYVLLGVMFVLCTVVLFRISSIEFHKEDIRKKGIACVNDYIISEGLKDGVAPHWIAKLMQVESGGLVDPVTVFIKSGEGRILYYPVLSSVKTVDSGEGLYYVVEADYEVDPRLGESVKFHSCNGQYSIYTYDSLAIEEDLTVVPSAFKNIIFDAD